MSSRKTKSAATPVAAASSSSSSSSATAAVVKPSDKATSINNISAQILSHPWGPKSMNVRQLATLNGLYDTGNMQAVLDGTWTAAPQMRNSICNMVVAMITTNATAKDKTGAPAPVSAEFQAEEFKERGVAFAMANPYCADYVAKYLKGAAAAPAPAAAAPASPVKKPKTKSDTKVADPDVPTEHQRAQIAAIIEMVAQYDGEAVNMVCDPSFPFSNKAGKPVKVYRRSEPCGSDKLAYVSNPLCVSASEGVKLLHGIAFSGTALCDSKFPLLPFVGTWDKRDDVYVDLHNFLVFYATVDMRKDYLNKCVVASYVNIAGGFEESTRSIAAAIETAKAVAEAKKLVDAKLKADASAAAEKVAAAALAATPVAVAKPPVTAAAAVRSSPASAALVKKRKLAELAATAAKAAADAVKAAEDADAEDADAALVFEDAPAPVAAVATPTIAFEDVVIVPPPSKKAKASPAAAIKTAPIMTEKKPEDKKAPKTPTKAPVTAAAAPAPVYVAPVVPAATPLVVPVDATPAEASLAASIQDWQNMFD